MTSEAPATPPAGPPPAAPPPRRQGGGFFSRLFAALLVIIITTSLALVGVAAAALQLGYTPNTPARIEGAYQQVATLQADNLLLQTQVAETSRRAADGSESLSEVEQRVVQLESVRQQIDEEVRATLRENATMIAELRTGRDMIEAYATVEAGRADVIRNLEQRSARLERFLQRLSDIADDAAFDLGSLQPSPTAGDTAATATPAAQEATATPTAEKTTTATPTAEETTTPTP
ncbi:MAG TPA: hypothetical protein PKC19_05485 [Roseiflexaceae bacterium]|nr:hypothetical protein [Roseiflexaceae bacterium]